VLLLSTLFAIRSTVTLLPRRHHTTSDAMNWTSPAVVRITKSVPAASTSTWIAELANASGSRIEYRPCLSVLDAPTIGADGGAASTITAGANATGCVLPALSVHRTCPSTLRSALPGVHPTTDRAPPPATRDRLPLYSASVIRFAARLRAS